MTLSYLPNLWRGAAIRTPDNAAPLGAGPASMLGPHGRFLFWTGTTIIFMKGPSRGIALPQLDRRITWHRGLAVPNLHTDLAAAGERRGGESAKEAAGLNAPRPRRCG